MTVIKIIMVLYPFLKELLMGKYADSPHARKIRIAVIVLIIVSLILNYYLIKSSFELGKYKIDSVDKMSNMQLEIITLKKQLDDSSKVEACFTPINKRREDPKPPPQSPTPIRREEDAFEETLHKKLRYIERMED